MSTFKSSATAEPVGDTHIHQPSACAEVAIRYLAIAAAFPAAYFAGVYLFAQAGYQEPYQVMATIIIYGAGGLITLIILSRWSAGALDRYYAHRELMEQERTKQLQYQQLMARSSVAESRQMGERHTRLADLVYLTMLAAYDQLARTGRTEFTGVARPWSENGVRRLIPANGQRPTATEAGEVKQFLVDNEVIAGEYPNEQLNLKRYPDIGSIQHLLYYPAVINQNR